ncbi:MAG TPA: gamma-glutamyl-gamma-aminobutyrate hydrolase family protein, partial [Candidatus Obscuribacterales bacterium]
MSTVEVAEQPRKLDDGALSDSIAILDFGSQYSQLIARRVRELNTYSELLPCTVSAQELKRLNPKGIILSGGPSSVYDAGAPGCDRHIWKLGVPVLGVCYGMQLMAQQLGGQVDRAELREYGRANL